MSLRTPPILLADRIGIFIFSPALPRRAFLFIEKGKQRYNQATKGHQQC